MSHPWRGLTRWPTSAPKTKEKPPTTLPKPSLELIWRDPAGAIQRKLMPWRKPSTDESLAEYLTDYLALLAEGYRPKDFNYIPTPHCARVHDRGKVLAEWHLKIKSPQRSAVACDESVSGFPAGEQSPQHHQSPATTARPIEPVPELRETLEGQHIATRAASGHRTPAA